MIRYQNVVKVYPDGTCAVADFTLDVQRGELLALVGPSGCGKSTLLRMLNRLIDPTSGRITLDGDDITDVDPVQLRRRIGYVIQAGGLFPHQRIQRNVMTVPKLLGWDDARARARADELLDLVGLDPSTFADRYPHELSGGQQQRVGVARALAADPSVLLMDEPFAAVDPIQRDRLQRQFRDIQTELGKTVLLVTHDIDEAVRLADRIAVLSFGGHVEQVATAATVLGAPSNDFVASFVGADRGLRRLAVTCIAAAELEQPPKVTTNQSLDQALSSIAAARFAVVVNSTGAACGWVRPEDCTHGQGARQGLGGAGRTISDRMLPLPQSVDISDTLHQALSVITTGTTDWLPVLDGDQYLGTLTPTSIYQTLRQATPS